MELRRMINADLSDVAKIEAEAFPDPYSERSISDILCTEGAMCFSAIVDGRVVAYFIGRLIAPEGELYRIATDPSFWKRGIAYRLLDYAVKSSRSHGLEAIAFNSLADAVRNAVDTARKEGRTLVCLGSLYLYGDIIKLI